MIIDKIDNFKIKQMNYYFAYGSNMSYEQMKERCPDSKYVGVARLNGYKLDFTKMSTLRGGGVADIVESADDCVYGVLYTITDDDLAKLDIKEQGYTKQTVSCFKYDDLLDYNPLKGTNIDALVYMVVNKSATTIPPSMEYLKIILDAAFYHMFPTKYQNMIYRFGYPNYNERLQKAIDQFVNYQTLISEGNFPTEVQHQEEWGGANLVITGDVLRKEQLNASYPHDLVVLTKHWKELTWLVATLYHDEHISWQVEASNKYYILELMGKAANSHLNLYHSDESPVGICLAVLYAAYKVFTIDFYKVY
jgi:gamma-glutamylcyclotransferase